MSWTADVPFPAEDLGECRGCGVPMGWVERANAEGKRHPVEAHGWAGIRVAKRVQGAKSGYTRDGEYAHVVEPPPEASPKGLTVVFESHFAFCPKAKRFGRR